MSSSFVDLLRSGVQGASNAAASNVSGPVDLLAWLLRKGGVPVPSNAFGGSEWMRQQGLTADPKNKLAGMLGEGVGLAAPFAIAAKAPQIAGAMNKADDALTAGANRMADHFERTGAAYKGPPNQRGAIVYHGSPHKFDKFDASKMGSGEGAQLYSQGLYLADQPAVGAEYIRAGRNVGFENWDNPGILADKAFAQANGDASAAAALLDDFAGKAKGRTQNINARLAKQVIEKGQQNASLYKVDLPDEKIARMLNWDNQLSQQAPEVLDAIGKLPKGWVNQGGSRRFYDPLQNMRRTGGALLQDLQLLQRGSPEALLRNAGVPGVRYLDGYSRGAGAGTSNYVVFPGEEAALNILERNGSPINALVQALKGPR